MGLTQKLLDWLLRHLNPCRHQWREVREVIEWPIGTPALYVIRVRCPGCGEYKE